MGDRNRQYYGTTSIFSAKAATGDSATIDVKSFRNAVFSLGTASSAQMTLKVKGGIGDSAPDFSAAASATNRWAFVDLALSNDGGAITDGDTGIVFTGTDGVRIFEVNTNGIDWVALSVTAYTAGSVTADLVITENS